MVLVLSFLITAFLYSCIGFGGGSTYNALLILNGIDYQAVPFISLICNIIVVSSGVWHFFKNGHIKFLQILPWTLFSVPASFIGGWVDVSEVVFTGVLGVMLLLSGTRMLCEDKGILLRKGGYRWSNKAYIPALSGSALGFLPGITGVGGGIFLVPVLHFVNWGKSKEIAGSCALFIFVNSLAGIMGQILKTGNEKTEILIFSHWLLFPSVLIGGQIGSWLGATRINAIAVKRATAALIIYAALRLLTKFLGML